MKSRSKEKSVVVVGGGPAGLTAAYELCKEGYHPIVLEKDSIVGGISRTEEYKGYRFDIGGHRFFTKVGEVEALWHEILGDNFLTRPRLSRIFYQGKFFPYPLKLWPTFRNLGAKESALIMASYLKAKLKTPRHPERTFEDFILNKFGGRLYLTFFKTYTEKVWGIPCTQIRSDWAAQRIKALSLKRMILNALFKNVKEASLIEEFQYPRLGPGMMWEYCQKHVERMGGEVRMEAEVVSVHHDKGKITHVVVRRGDREETLRGEHFVNSMPINHLMYRLDPKPPEEVVAAANGLSYRDFIAVALIVDEETIFPDNWIYIHSPEVRVGRIQNFKNWSEAMVPDQSKTCLGMEYFCSLGDDLWEMSDDDLVALATNELAEIGLANTEQVKDGTVIRQPKAYPVYDEMYKKHLAVIRDYLKTFSNLHTVGRAGMHRYNNQDHSMLTAMLAVRNIMGEKHDLWEVNVERSYHEEFTVREKEEHDMALEDTSLAA
jgi:protoporphyrinogen oxidase